MKKEQGEGKKEREGSEGRRRRRRQIRDKFVYMPFHSIMK